MAFLNGRFGGDGGVGSEYLSGLLAGLNTDQATETPPPAVMSVGLPQLPPQYPETGDGGAAGMGGMLGGLLGKMGGLFGNSEGGGGEMGGGMGLADDGTGTGGFQSEGGVNFNDTGGLNNPGIGGGGGGDMSFASGDGGVDDPGIPKQSHYLNAYRRVYG